MIINSTFCYHIRRRMLLLQEQQPHRRDNSVIAEQQARQVPEAVGTVAEQAADNPAVAASAGNLEGHRP